MCNLLISLSLLGLWRASTSFKPIFLIDYTAQSILDLNSPRFQAIGIIRHLDLIIITFLFYCNCWNKSTFLSICRIRLSISVVSNFHLYLFIGLRWFPVWDWHWMTVVSERSFIFYKFHHLMYNFFWHFAVAEITYNKNHHTLNRRHFVTINYGFDEKTEVN